MYLFRVGEQGQGIIYRQIDNAVMYSMSDFDFNGKFAYRVFAQYNLNRRWSVEGVFTRLQNDWNATGIASDNVQPDVEPIELRADGITIVSPTETFTLGYSTEFQTGELNAKYYLNDWSLNLLGGFRWVDVNEQFSSFITNTSTHFDYSTTNRMYGGQFGIESQHWLGYGVMRLDLGLKGGIYQNHSTFQTTPVGAISASDSGNGIAWLGEANIGLTMPIFRHGCLRAGYRAYHMTGLAIAADQLNAADLTVGTAQINQDGQALYHGVSLGFEYWF
ncbi:hypothetical protein GC197_08880 [bacterium]|nr:hypothetical protein [bacterium]